MTTQKYLDNTIGELQDVCRMIGLRDRFVNKSLKRLTQLFLGNLNLAILVSLRNTMSEQKYKDDLCFDGALKVIKTAELISEAEYLRKNKILANIRKKFEEFDLHTKINKGFVHSTVLREDIVHIKEVEVNTVVDELSKFVESEISQFFETSIDFQAKRENYVGFWDKDWEILLKSGLVTDPTVEK